MSPEVFAMEGITLNREESTPVDDNVTDEVQAAESQGDGTPTSVHDAASDDAAGAINEISETEAALRAKANEYLEGWQRTRAEFANYKRRTEREITESRERGALDALSSLLPIIDDFERAIANVPEELQDNPWTSGTTLLMRKFEKLLAEYNVEVIDPTGQPFDPSQHEAIGMEASDTVESGHITVTLQKGYLSGERVLRPALVRVAN
jgi:molecular chaperone GrpE